MNHFIFPLNYSYSTKFLGIIDYKSLFYLVIYGIIIVVFLYLLNLDFFIAVGIFIFLFIPPFLLISCGINNQPTLSYLKALFIFYKRPKLYLYKNHCKK